MENQRTRVIAARALPVAVADALEGAAERRYSGERDAELLRGLWLRGAAAGYCGGYLLNLDTPEGQAFRAGYQYGVAAYAERLGAQQDRADYADIMVMGRPA